jgi:hypothetical protein
MPFWPKNILTNVKDRDLTPFFCECQGLRLSFSSKTRIKKLYLQDLSSDEMLEILMDDILSGKI